MNRLSTSDLGVVFAGIGVVMLAGGTLYFGATFLSEMTEGHSTKATLRFNCETGVQYRPLPDHEHVWTPVVDDKGELVPVDPARCEPSYTRKGREIHSPSRVYSYPS